MSNMMKSVWGKNLFPTNHDIIGIWNADCVLRKMTFLQITHDRLSCGIWKGLSIDVISIILTNHIL